MFTWKICFSSNNSFSDWTSRFLKADNMTSVLEQIAKNGWNLDKVVKIQKQIANLPD